jgi:WD40 repeat protein
MSLSTEYLIRNSYFEMKDMSNVKVVEEMEISKKVGKMKNFFDKFYAQSGGEYLVTGSDDNTINLFCLGRLTTTQSVASDSDTLLRKGLTKRSHAESNLKEIKVFSKFSFKNSLEKQKKVAENFSLIRRYTGHSKAINHVQFAPNGFLFISASFDKSLRVWNVVQNGCLAVLRGHVAAVYRYSNL